MTKNQIKNIIQSGKIPNDELDKGKYWGFIFPGVIILTFGIPLLPFIEDNTSLSFKWIGFTLGIVVLIYTYINFKKEKNIKTINTRLDQESNSQIIETYFSEQNIPFTKYSNYYLSSLPRLFYKRGLKLIIIPWNNIILVNIRTKGFSAEGGRVPFSVAKQIQQNKLTKELKNLSTIPKNNIKI